MAPARAALGSGGCTDCHRSDSPFFQGPVLDAAFASSGAKPRWRPNYEILGVSQTWVRLGAFREERLKPLVYGLCGILLLLFVGLAVQYLAASRLGLRARPAAAMGAAVAAIGIVAFARLALSPEWLGYITVQRFTLDAHHAWVSMAAFLLAAGAVLLPWPGGAAGRGMRRACAIGAGMGLLLAALSGAIMVLGVGSTPGIARLAYSSLEIGLALALLFGLAIQVLHLLNAMLSTPARQDGGSDGRHSPKDAKDMDHQRGSA